MKNRSGFTLYVVTIIEIYSVKPGRAARGAACETEPLSLAEVHDRDSHSTDDLVGQAWSDLPDGAAHSPLQAEA